MIFEDNFDSLDLKKWKHGNTLAGGGNWEFQWYVNNRLNSNTTGGALHLRPTLTSDIYGEKFLTSGRVVIPPNECTQAEWHGCDRQGTSDNLINPIRSARVDTRESFSFKYGTLEIRAKMPQGDWIWPALWLMPKDSVYGGWPRSGAITLMEMRGNRNLFNGNVNVGVEQAGSTLHYGPSSSENGWPKAHYTRNENLGFADDFHVYKLVWTPSFIQFSVDGNNIGTVNAEKGFWARGGFSGANIWEGREIMAPFDQEFYIIMNNAVGGVGFFADGFVNRDYPKPW